MATSDKLSRFETGRLVRSVDLQDNLVNPLRKADQDNLRLAYERGGVFHESLGLVSQVVDQIDVVGLSHATDGLGHVLVPSTDTYCSGVSFENTAAVQYHVALHHCEVPDGLVISPRTGTPQFETFREAIGTSGEPDSVVQESTNLKFIVDSVCEAGSSHGGRNCLVYLNEPKAPSEAEAIETAVVSFDGGQNVVTVGLFGQSSPSLDPSNYTVVLLGPTIWRDNVPDDSAGYCFLGTVTGGGVGYLASVLDTSNQRIHPTVQTVSETIERIGGVTPYRPYQGPKNDCPVASWNGCAAGFGSKLFYFGGSTGDDALAFTKDCYVFDVPSNTWTPLPDFPDDRSFGARAAEIDGIIYIAGGSDGSTVTSALRRFNPATQTWMTNAAAMPGARYSGCLEAIGGKLFYVGGASDVVRPEMWSYDPSADAWTVEPSCPVGRFDACSGSDGENLFLAGGSQYIRFSPEDNAKDFLKFNVSTRAWGTLQDLPNPARGSVMVVQNGVVHVLYGDQTIYTGIEPDFSTLAAWPGFSGHHFLYSQAEGVWITGEVTSVASVRAGASAAVVDGYAVFVGGRQHESFTTAKEVFASGSNARTLGPDRPALVEIKSWGAGGGLGYKDPAAVGAVALGGAGAFAKASGLFDAVPVLVYLGGGGQQMDYRDGDPGSPAYHQGGGHGGSLIAVFRDGSVDHSKALLVAGSGGGGGFKLYSDSVQAGGAAGDGTYGGSGNGNTGTAGGGGVGGSGATANGENGSALTGGNAALDPGFPMRARIGWGGSTGAYSTTDPTHSGIQAGGGGAGYYGGGGGSISTDEGAGGAGGSSYVDSGYFYDEQIISSTGAEAPNTADPEYMTGVAVGGGEDPLIVDGGSGRTVVTQIKGFSGTLLPECTVGDFSMCRLAETHGLIGAVGDSSHRDNGGDDVLQLKPKNYTTNRSGEIVTYKSGDIYGRINWNPGHTWGALVNSRESS